MHLSDSSEAAAPAALEPGARRRNIAFLGIDAALFMAALGLLGPITLVPLFVSKLTDSALAIGLLTAAFQLGWLPQLFFVGLLERTSHKRRWLLIAGALERVPVLGLVLAALALPLIGVPLALALIYLSRFAQSVAAGPAATTWMDYVAGSVPPRQRGRFMSWSTTLGHLLGAVAAALAVPLLDRLGFPLGFAACFGLALAILLAGFLPLFWVVEPPGPPPRAARPYREQLAELPAVLTADRPFRRFLLGMCMASLSGMCAPFLVVYAVAELGAADEQAAWYTATMLVGQVLANLLFGWLADRSGFTTVAWATSLSVVGLAAVALVAPDPLWIHLSFALLGANWAGTLLARLVGPIEYAAPDRRPTYIALVAASTSLAGAVAPLLGSQVVATLGYDWLFWGSLVLAAGATLILRGGARPSE